MNKTRMEPYNGPYLVGQTLQRVGMGWEFVIVKVSKTKVWLETDTGETISGYSGWNSDKGVTFESMKNCFNLIGRKYGVQSMMRILRDT